MLCVGLLPLVYLVVTFVIQFGITYPILVPHIVGWPSHINQQYRNSIYEPIDMPKDQSGGDNFSELTHGFLDPKRFRKFYYSSSTICRESLSGRLMPVSSILHLWVFHVTILWSGNLQYPWVFTVTEAKLSPMTSYSAKSPLLFIMTILTFKTSTTSGTLYYIFRLDLWFKRQLCLPQTTVLCADPGKHLSDDFSPVRLVSY